MKNDLASLGFLLFVLFIFIFFSSSCAGVADGESLGYAKKSFRCDITGYVNGKEINASLTHLSDASDDGIKAVLSFSSPKGIEGMTVTVSQNGDCKARLGDKTIGSKGLGGLVEPFEPIFDVGNACSVRKTQDGATEVSVCDENCDLKYIFLPNSSVPSRIFGKSKGNDIDFNLSNFSFDFVFEK